MHLRNESRRRTRKTGAEEIIEMMGEKLLLTAVNVGTAGMTMRLITLMFNSLAPSLKVFWPSKKILTFLCSSRSTGSSAISNLERENSWFYLTAVNFSHGLSNLGQGCQT